MDIVQLRYFLKTAQRLNYTKAAEELFITRQSLRQAISALEKELGGPLFVNERNKLTLTELGEYLAFSGAGVVDAFDAMRTELNRLARRQITLRVAFSGGLFPFLLPETEPILERFRAKFPHIRLESCVAGNDEVIQMAQAGEIDCGCVLQMPTARPGCVMRPLVDFPVAIDSAPGFPISQKEELSPEDLEGVACIGMGELAVTMQPLWEACRAGGIVLNYQVCRNTIDAFYQVQHGLAAGFDILAPVDYSIPVLSRRLKGYTWELGFLCPKNRPDPRAADLFCTFMAAAFEERFRPEDGK